MFFQCIFKLIQIFLWVSQQFILSIEVLVNFVCLTSFIVLKELLLILVNLIEVDLGLSFKLFFLSLGQVSE